MKKNIMDYQQAQIQAEQKHFNVLGDIIGGAALAGVFSGPNDAALTHEQYAIAKSTYPTDNELSSCDQLNSTVTNLQNVIDSATRSKADDDSNGNQRVQNRIINGYSQYQNEVKAMSNNLQCVAKAKSEKDAASIASAKDVATFTQNLANQSSVTTKYLIYGMLGIVIIASGIILFKKHK